LAPDRRRRRPSPRNKKKKSTKRSPDQEWGEIPGVGKGKKGKGLKKGKQRVQNVFPNLEFKKERVYVKLRTLECTRRKGKSQNANPRKKIETLGRTILKEKTQ